MLDLGVAFFTVCFLFGTFTGFVLGRNPEDRLATLTATAFCLLFGAASWAVGAPGSTAEVAGASMTIGGATAGLVLAATGHRTANTT